MKIKDYLIAVGTAAAGALAITLFLALLALIGWPVVWVAFVITFIPFTYKLVQEYRERENDGFDFIVFLFEVKFVEWLEGKTKRSKIDL